MKLKISANILDFRLTRARTQVITMAYLAVYVLKEYIPSDLTSLSLSYFLINYLYIPRKSTNIIKRFIFLPLILSFFAREYIYYFSIIQLGGMIKLKKDRSLAFEICLYHFNIFIPLYLIGFLIKNINRLSNEREKTKNLEMEIQEQSTMALLGESLAGIVHDIRTPLAVIGNYNELNRKKLMKKSLLDIGIIKGLDKIDQAAVDIENIADFYRELVKSESFIPTYINLDSFFKDLKIYCNDRLMSKNVDLKIQSLTNIQLLVSRPALLLACTNLINNAVDAYKSKDQKIIISTNLKDKKFIINIEDFAGGIPEKYQKNLFKKKFSTKLDKDGTGIGLKLVKKTLDSVDAEIQYTPTELGSIFSIIFDSNSISMIRSFKVG